MKIQNRQARHKYMILETLEAGVVLSGAEVKSIRAGRVNLSESFIKIVNGQAYLKNAYIHPYQDSREYDPSHDRKLLLHKAQINMLSSRIQKGGMALVPLSIYEKNNMFKVELAVGASKKKYDHRRAVKERDENRRIQQELKG